MKLSGSILSIALLLVALTIVLAPDESALAVEDDSECLRWRRAFAGMPTATLGIRSSRGHRIQIPARMAGTDEARWAGFQCATRDEIRTTVIVFDFHREVVGGFHMQNVAAPLDIAFVKGAGRIFSILRMDPSPTARYGPMGAYRYAIEARTGFFKERGIFPGDEMVLESR